MPRLRILICGGGVAGYALASWLAKVDFDVTVVERWPALRENGLQVDVRGLGLEVMKLAGLFQTFRTKLVAEQGMEIIDKRGRVRAFFPPDGGNFTSDYEIMRGDLVRLLYETSRDKVTSIFGTSVSEIRQHDDHVEVTFADGNKAEYDLVVGADGQGSRTRKMMLSADDSRDPIQWLGQAVAYFTTSRDIQAPTDYRAKSFVTTKSGLIITRRHATDKVQVYLICEPGEQTFQQLRKGDVEADKKAFADIYRGTGWKSDEILRAMQESEDFYCERPGVVRSDIWSSGRVALVGDAAYGPTFNTGMGTTSGIIGAYVLAGEISKLRDRPTATTEDVAACLKSYADIFQPFMQHVQRGVADGARMGLPKSAWGVTIMNASMYLASKLRPSMMRGFSPSTVDKNWTLPDYPQMTDPRNKTQG